MFEATIWAAAFAGVATVISAWIAFRGSTKTARLKTTTDNLDAQLRGWAAYCDELQDGLKNLRADYNVLREQLLATDKHARDCENSLRAATFDLEQAKRRIVVLEERSGIRGG